MSKPQRTLPSLADIKNAVKEVARQSDIPTVTFPSAQGTQAAPNAAEETLHAAATNTEAPAPSAHLVTLQSPPVTQERKVRGPKPAPVRRTSVDLPVYLIEEITDKAYRKKCKKRTLILNAFKDAGFTVKDIDLQERKADD
jgi:hypothetical protein